MERSSLEITHPELSKRKFGKQRQVSMASAQWPSLVLSSWSHRVVENEGLTPQRTERAEEKVSFSICGGATFGLPAEDSTQAKLPLWSVEWKRQRPWLTRLPVMNEL